MLTFIAILILLFVVARMYINGYWCEDCRYARHLQRCFKRQGLNNVLTRYAYPVNLNPQGRKA